MQKPSVGRIVLVTVDPKINNGADVAPAIITRVWSEGRDVTLIGNPRDTACINVKVFLDQYQERWLTSITLYEERQDDTEAVPHDVDGNPRYAYWPPRVGA